MSDTMSETPLEASPPGPDPDPDSDSDSDIGDDERGLPESCDVIRVRRPPKASRQDGATRHSGTAPASEGQGLRRMESCGDPNDKSTLPRPKLKTPGMEAQRPLMWESCVQCCAICDNGRAPRPRHTSDASSRECSALHMKDGPRECVPAATAPATVTGPSATPPSPSPLRPLPHPPRAVTAPAEDSQRGVRRDITHYARSRRRI